MPDMQIEVVTLFTFYGFLYLLLALFVERCMEVFVSVFNYLEWKWGWSSLWNSSAKRYQKRLDRLYSYQGPTLEMNKKALDWVLWKVLADRPYPEGREVVSADLIRLNYVRISSRFLAFLFSSAIVFAQWKQLDFINILNRLVESKMLFNGSLGFLDPILKQLLQVEWLRKVLTAVAISIGVEPLHELIRSIEQATTKKAVNDGGAA